MTDGPLIAGIAALLGDPGRANMLTALMDGRALTVGELARAARITLPTASGHIAKLEAAGLLKAEKQGRHRYLRLSGSDVAEVLERLMGLAQRTGAVPIRTGPRDAALREARVCYDHLAGGYAVALMQKLVEEGWLSDADPPILTREGREGLAALGIDVDALEDGRRPLGRCCLDWSERRHHLGGALGAAILEVLLERGWVRRGEGRVLRFTAPGMRAFQDAFGLRERAPARPPESPKAQAQAAFRSVERA